MKTFKIWFYFIFVALMGFYCTDFSNPFLNTENAFAKISNKNFSDGDTIKIFSEKSLSVIVYLKENVDKYKLHIDKNRLWRSDDTVIINNKFTKEPITFAFSFYDTGRQLVTLTSYKYNGDTVVENYTLYTYSPLYQNAISGAAGDSILLKTNPVDDKVLYVWNFRKGTPIKDQSPEVYTTFTNAMTSTVGELYVEDFNNHKSPVVLFHINPVSSSELKILCANETLKGDSVYTNNSDLPLKLQVFGAEQIKKLTVNGVTVSNLTKVENYFSCTVNLQRLDTLNAPLPVVVEVADNRDQTVKHTFYASYIKSEPGIVVTYPGDDSVETMSSPITITGKVTNIGSYRSSYLVIRNNGKIQNQKLISTENADFSFVISFSENKNHIALELFTDTMMTSRLAVNDFYMFYAPESKDIIPPQIRNVRGNGTTLTRVTFSRTDTLNLEIDAVDNSNVLSVSVDGVSTVKNESSYLFTSKVILTHKVSGDTIIIKATDSAGLSDIDTFNVFYNKKPLWKQIPQSYLVINAGDLTLFTIKAEDPDADSLSVSMTIKTDPEKIFTISNGTVGWRPELKDTGEHRIELVAWDGYEEVDTNFIVMVKSPAGSVPVKLLTKSAEIPDTLYVNELFQLELQEVPSTGTRPFKYTAIFTDKPSSTLLNGNDNILKWAPLQTDTGYKILKIVISDSLGAKDSLQKPVQIIRRSLADVKWDEFNNISFNENGTNNILPKVKLSKPLKSTVSVSYTIELVSPTDTADIEKPYSGVVTFAAGDTIASVPVTLVDDTIPEITETFRIRLTGSDSIVLKGTDVFTGQIIDDDIVWYYFEEPEGTGKESVTNVSIKIKLSKPMGQPIELLYSTDERSSATYGKDFTFVDQIQKLTINPGVTEKLINLRIINDKIPEKDEVIILNLKSENDIVKPKNSAVYEYTIIDNDTAAHYSFTSGTVSGSENDTLDTLVIKLDKPVDTVTVLKLTVDNSSLFTTATEGEDFKFVDRVDSIVFPRGTMLKNIRIKIFDDTIPEEDEAISLNLQSNSEYLAPGAFAHLSYTIKTNEVSVNFDADSSKVNEWSINGPLLIGVKLSGELKNDLTIYYQEDPNSSAGLGKDYYFTEPCRCITFKPGETYKQFVYGIYNDCEFEPTEYAAVRISRISNKKVAYIGDKAKIIIKIDDNDSPFQCR